MKTKIYNLQNHTYDLYKLGLFGLFLIGVMFSTNRATASGIEENDSVYELIKQVETYRHQDRYQSKEQRNVLPGTVFNMVDTRNNEISYTPKFTLNHSFNIVEVDSTALPILNDVPSLTDVQGEISDGKDVYLFSESELNNFSTEIERMN